MTDLRLPAPRRRRLSLGIALGVALILFIFPTLVRLLAEWPWFSALGYERVFGTRIVAATLLGIVTGGFAFAFLYLNLRFAQRGVVPKPVVMRMNAQTPPVDVTRLVRRLALPAALGLGLLFGLAASSGWLPVMAFLRQTPFGVTDPLFGRDIAYYVFSVPVVAGVLGVLLALGVLSLL